MNETETLDPAVRSILRAARAREAPADSLSVDARSIERAIDATAATDRTPVIAEIKPTSPTTDGERRDDPADLAKQMVAGGATALSVLTEPEHFGGSPAALRHVRNAVDVPVLRKDFLLDEAELDRVRADTVLVIARFVDDLGGMIAAALDRGMRPLVEVHTEAELSSAIDAGASLIGINNRDLGSLDVDLSVVERLAPKAPGEVTVIAESGVGSPADVTRMRAAGADALLIGSAIMDGDVETRTRELVHA